MEILIQYSQMKIAIFGGRFDPAHIGHFLVVKQVLKFRKDIDKLLLVPTFNTSGNRLLPVLKTEWKC